LLESARALHAAIDATNSRRTARHCRSTFALLSIEALSMKSAGNFTPSSLVAIAHRSVCHAA
jgi:hypothetical protein